MTKIKGEKRDQLLKFIGEATLEGNSLSAIQAGVLLRFGIRYCVRSISIFQEEALAEDRRLRYRNITKMMDAWNGCEEKIKKDPNYADLLDDLFHGRVDKEYFDCMVKKYELA